MLAYRELRDCGRAEMWWNCEAQSWENALILI